MNEGSKHFKKTLISRGRTAGHRHSPQNDDGDDDQQQRQQQNQFDAYLNPQQMDNFEMGAEKEEEEEGEEEEEEEDFYALLQRFGGHGREGGKTAEECGCGRRRNGIGTAGKSAADGPGREYDAPRHSLGQFFNSEQRLRDKGPSRLLLLIGNAERHNN